MRRALVVVLVLAVAVVAPGCGSEDADGGGKQALIAAAKRTLRKATSSSVLYMNIDAGDRQLVRFRGRTAANRAGTRARLDGRMTVPGEGSTAMRAVVIRRTSYFAFPAVTRVLPGEGRWIRFTDRSAPADAMSQRDFVKVLRAAGHVETRGVDRIRGRRATHYVAHVPVDALLVHFPRNVRRRLKRLRTASVATTIDVWVDRKGLFRRIAIDFEHEGDRLRVSADRIRYGVPLRVRRPAPATVVDGNRLRRALR